MCYDGLHGGGGGSGGQLLMAECAKYFQTRMAKHFINIFSSIFFFRSGRSWWKSKTNNVLFCWHGMRNRCLVLSCHKSGTSFRFLMILILVCVEYSLGCAFFFLFTLYDSFVYDRNIHLTTSFRRAAARALTSIADGDDSFFLSAVFIRRRHWQWIKWSGAKGRKKAQRIRAKWMN